MNLKKMLAILLIILSLGSAIILSKNLTITELGLPGTELSFMQSLNWYALRKNDRFAYRVELDLLDILEKNSKFAKAWQNVGQIDVLLHSDFAKTAFASKIKEKRNPISLPLNKKGTLTAEFDFIDDTTLAAEVPKDHHIVLQIGLIDNRTQNKLYEFARAYTIDDL